MKYEKPCGCRVESSRPKLEPLPFMPNTSQRTVHVSECPEHEFVLVLRKIGDKGTLGPKEAET